MADRGRDLKISILSEADRFDLDKPAGELDDLGDKAKSTAKRVDDAFDKMGKSSKATSKQIEKGARDAGEGLDNLKDEAGSTGREAAASFSGGFDDIAGAIQEIGANAFAGFGPVGAAAGLAAAAGIGILVAQMQEANERIKAARESLRELGLDADTTGLDRFNAAWQTLAENDNLDQLRKSVELAGVSWDDYMDAVVNGGPKLDTIKGKLYDLGSSAGGLAGIWDDNVQGAQAAYDALDQYRQGATGAAADLDAVKPKIDALTAAQEAQAIATAGLDAAQKASATAAEEAAAANARAAESQRVAITSALEAAADATGPLTKAVQESAEAQAKSTKDAGDSWDDYKDTVKLSAKDVVKVLTEQTKAAETFRANLLEVQQRGDMAFTEWVSQQPAQVAKAYADGTSKEKGAIYAAFKRNVGAQQALGTAAGMTENAGKPKAAAAGVRSDMEFVMTSKGPIVVPVGVTGPSGAELARIRSNIRAGLSNIRVSVDAIAQTALGRSVP